MPLHHGAASVPLAHRRGLRVRGLWRGQVRDCYWTNIVCRLQRASTAWIQEDPVKHRARPVPRIRTPRQATCNSRIRWRRRHWELNSVSGRKVQDSSRISCVEQLFGRDVFGSSRDPSELDMRPLSNKSCCTFCWGFMRASLQLQHWDMRRWRRRVGVHGGHVRW